MSAFLTACLHVCLSVCQPSCLSVCLCLSISLSLYLSVCLSVCLSVFLSVYLSFCLDVSSGRLVSNTMNLIKNNYVRSARTQFVCLFVCLSVCLSICLSVCQSVYFSVCQLWKTCTQCAEFEQQVITFGVHAICLFVCLSVCLPDCLWNTSLIVQHWLVEPNTGFDQQVDVLWVYTICPWPVCLSI